MMEIFEEGDNIEWNGSESSLNYVLIKLRNGLMRQRNGQ